MSRKSDRKTTSGPARRRRSGRGALLAIALLFLGSGLLRLGDGTGAAIAREVAALGEIEEGATTDLLACPNMEGVPELLASLQMREARIELQETEIIDRLQALALAESAYEQNISALIEAENALSQTMARSETAAEDDIARLTEVYENMKPKDAATLFEEMAPEFSAGFLARMRPDAAAPVMAGLSPQTAYTISVILAGRNAGAPTE